MANSSRRLGARRPGCGDDRCQRAGRTPVRRAAARRRNSAARPAPSNATIDGVDQEQRQRRGQQNAPQIVRFGIGVAGALRAQRSGVERRDAVGCRQRVDRERAVGGTIEAGRMIRRRAVAVSRRAAASRWRAAVRTRRSHRACAAAPPSPRWSRPRRRRPAWRCSRTHRRSVAASRRSCRTSAGRTSACRR